MQITISPWQATHQQAMEKSIIGSNSLFSTSLLLPHILKTKSDPWYGVRPWLAGIA